jgi:hypothetical protein
LLLLDCLLLDWAGGVEAMGVDTIGRVQREHFTLYRSILEISRDLHLLLKILRSEVAEFHHKLEVQTLPMMVPCQEQLHRLLLANEGKSSRE